MAITADMINQKVFRTVGKGYDPNEVDEFLDAVCDEFDAMQAQIKDLNERLAAAAVRPAPVPFAPLPVQSAAAPAPAPAPVQPAASSAQSEDSFRRLLINAQRVCDETIADAKKEAEDLLSDARRKADEELGGIIKSRDEIKTELDNLKMSAMEYRDRYRQLMEEQKKLLDEQSDLFAE